MRKYILTLAMVLLTANSWAGTSNLDIVTVSRTLTLTSPSATLTMNGVSATAFLRNVSVTGVLSATTVSATNGNFNNISSTQVSKAWGNIDGASATIRKGYNVASVQRITNGQFGVSFTTPMPDANYSVVANPFVSGNNATCLMVGGSGGNPISPTTVGFRVNMINCSSGVGLDGQFYFNVFTY